MSFFHKSGIVNVKMVITEEKILSNIDKVQKLINPNSKKQIVQLEDDSYFKDLVESIKTYLIEYPKKKNFPRSVYKAAYNLVEYATNQFEENTKRIEELIRKREKNIKLASVLRDATAAIKAKAKNWREIVKKLSTKYPADVAQALNIIGGAQDKESEEYQAACKLIEAKINNLESNLHIEIDMERIEDRSKALSYIGIEIAEALKYIPAPADEFLFEKEEEEQEVEQAPVAKAEIKNEVKEVVKEETIEERKETPIIPKPVSIDKVTQKPATVVAQEPNKVEKVEEIKQVSVKAEEPKQEVKSAIIQEAVKIENKEIKEDVSVQINEQEQAEFLEETRLEEKPSLWQRIKNSKIVKAIRYVMKIRVVLVYPALPEGKGE